MELAQLIRNMKEDEPVPHIILIFEFCSLKENLHEYCLDGLLWTSSLAVYCGGRTKAA